MENINELYRCSYKEVFIILNALPDAEKTKIPKEKFDFYRECMNKEYNTNIDLLKPIAEQNLLKQTRAILANIFKMYLATDEEKHQILLKEKREWEIREEEKRKKYNPDNIFKNDNNVITEKKENISVADVAMIEYKESVFKRICNKLKRIFK